MALSGFLGYPEPEDQFSKIIKNDKELQELVSPDDDLERLNDPKNTIIEDEIITQNDIPDDGFWSDR